MILDEKLYDTNIYKNIEINFNSDDIVFHVETIDDKLYQSVYTINEIKQMNSLIISIDILEKMLKDLKQFNIHHDKVKKYLIFDFSQKIKYFGKIELSFNLFQVRKDISINKHIIDLKKHIGQIVKQNQKIVNELKQFKLITENYYYHPNLRNPIFKYDDIIVFSKFKFDHLYYKSLNNTGEQAHYEETNTLTFNSSMFPGTRVNGISPYIIDSNSSNRSFNRNTPLKNYYVIEYENEDGKPFLSSEFEDSDIDTIIFWGVDFKFKENYLPETVENIIFYDCKIDCLDSNCSENIMNIGMYKCVCNEIDTTNWNQDVKLFEAANTYVKNPNFKLISNHNHPNDNLTIELKTKN